MTTYIVLYAVNFLKFNLVKKLQACGIVHYNINNDSKTVTFNNRDRYCVQDIPQPSNIPCPPTHTQCDYTHTQAHTSIAVVIADSG